MGETVFVAAGGASGRIHCDEECQQLDKSVVLEKDRDVLWDDMPECSVCFGDGGRDQPADKRQARIEVHKLRTDGGEL